MSTEASKTIGKSETAPRPGIGESGSTLQAMAAHTTARLEETGCYYGVEELGLKTDSYLKYESFHARMRAAVVNARESSKKICASPGVREVGESVVAFYTPEGDSIVLSTGIMVHVHTLSRFIKWMIDNDYERDPGIAHGDIFCNNDPFISDVHPPDLMNVIPVFWEGEVIGWVGAVAHQLEIGGVHGGANMSTTAERFGQGMIISAEKVGSNDEIRRDFLVRAEMNLRTPIYFILDEKAMVGACVEVRETVCELVREYGLDFYKRGIREIIEEGRRAHLERMKLQTVPGRYRGAAFCGHLFSGKRGASALSRDVIVHTPLEMNIATDGFMEIDFEGAGSSMWNAFNCPPSAMEGGFFVTLTQFMDYDGKVSDGCWFATNMLLPEGTWCNPGDHLTSTSSAWASLMPGFGCLQRMVSRAFLARGFYEEVFLGQCNTPIMEGGGINQYGQKFGGQNLECAAEGSGARGVMDGIDCGYVGWNPESDLGNIEIWEQTLPILYFGRRIWTDALGAGKYRSGATFSSLLKIHNSPIYNMVSTIHSDKVFDNQGLCGGYPGPSLRFSHVSRETNLDEIIAARKPLPHVEGDPHDPDMKKLVDGKFTTVEGIFLDDALTDGDLFQFFYNTAGGYGDPIERDPELARIDLDKGIQTPPILARVCGIVASYDDNTRRHAIDVEATDEARKAMREARLARAVPVQEWLDGEKKKIEARQLGDPAKEMFDDIFKVSPKWAEEYREFWGLPDEFDFGTNAIR